MLIIFLLRINFPALNSGGLSTRPQSLTTLPDIISVPGFKSTRDVLPSNKFAPYSPTPTSKQIPIQPARTSSIPISNSPVLVPTSTDDPFSDKLLPDLQTLPPSDLRLVYDADSGRSLIRFSNSIWNSGPGKLELIGIPNQSGDQIRVSQRVYFADQERFDEFEVGEFKFHDQHNHWHLEQFAVYEVWSVDERGSLESMVSAGGKVSYCIMDVSLAETNNSDESISTNRSYTHCEEGTQGLSVGWIDTYKYFYWGQWVDISSLEDGTYALVSTVDPGQLLREADIDNNMGLTYFEIRETSLKVIEERFFKYDDYLIPNSYLEP